MFAASTPRFCSSNSAYRIITSGLSEGERVVVNGQYKLRPNAKVTVTRKGDRIIVRVEDDGRGFDPSRTRGMGLLGMEERVRRLNGTFEVKSVPGQGTAVTTELPVSRSDKA